MLVAAATKFLESLLGSVLPERAGVCPCGRLARSLAEPVGWYKCARIARATYDQRLWRTCAARSTHHPGLARGYQPASVSEAIMRAADLSNSELIRARGDDVVIPRMLRD